MNVMLLEDDAIIAMDIETIIKSVEGLKCYNVSNMQDALKQAHKIHIDIAICDINLNGVISGIEVAKTMQKLYKCQILFLTSYSDERTLIDASEVDFSGYILKPFKEEELLTQVRLLANKARHCTVKEVIDDNYYYDRKNHMLYFNEEPLILTPKEHQLFLLLLNAKTKMVPYGVIDSIIWQDSIVTDTTRRQLFHRLKAKTPGLTYESIAFGGYVFHR